MKAKTLIACAVTASVLPFAALAQNNAQPTGPQGTGWYGAPNAARPTPQENQMAEPNAGRIERRADTRERYRDRRAYDGFSADTNPPTPAP